MSTTGEKSFTFPCECGATLRARLVIVGRKARCNHCGRMITIPKPRQKHSLRTRDENGTGSKASALAVAELCSICQTPIESDEPKTECSKCGLPFHEECWRENMGCSAYGCPNVNALKTGPDIRITSAPPPPASVLHAVEPQASEDGIPWEFVLLAASVFAAGLGAFIYGLPSIVVAVINGVYLAKTARRPNIAVTVAGFIVCGIGIGIPIGYWFGIYSQ